jgi:hypothetical protein
MNYNFFVIILCNTKYRLGVLDMAELYLTQASPECKRDISTKIENVKGYLIRAKNARKDEQWITALKEVNAAIAAGVDMSQPVIKC